MGDEEEGNYPHNIKIPLTIYDCNVVTMRGYNLSLKTFKGRVLLIVIIDNK